MNCQAVRPERVLDELPGRAAGAGAARGRPFERLGTQTLRLVVEAEMRSVAVDHVEILVLAALVEAKPQAEAVGQGDLLLHGLTRVDGRRALVLHHVARQQVATVGGGVEDDVLRASLDAAFEHSLQRLVGGVVGVERQVVAEDDEPVRIGLEQRHQGRQALDVLAVDLHQLQRAGTVAGQPHVGLGVDGLDEGGLAHAARAPQQGVVGGQAAGEALGVLRQHVAHAVDAAQKDEIDPVDLRNGVESGRGGMPDEGVRRIEIGRRRGGRSDSLEGVGDPRQRRQQGVRVRAVGGRLCGHSSACHSSLDLCLRARGGSRRPAPDKRQRPRRRTGDVVPSAVTTGGLLSAGSSL